MAGQQFYQHLMSQTTFASFLNECRKYSHLAGHNGVGGEVSLSIDVQA
jgi:hypothetical protein